jgi:hypothetical protein
MNVPWALLSRGHVGLVHRVGATFVAQNDDSQRVQSARWLFALVLGTVRAASVVQRFVPDASWQPCTFKLRAGTHHRSGDEAVVWRQDVDVNETLFVVASQSQSPAKTSRHLQSGNVQRAGSSIVTSRASIIFNTAHRNAASSGNSPRRTPSGSSRPSSWSNVSSSALKVLSIGRSPGPAHRSRGRNEVPLGSFRWRVRQARSRLCCGW